MKQRTRQRQATETAEGALLAKREQRAMKKAIKKEIVKRSAVMRIVAAWIVTVPATAVPRRGTLQVEPELQPHVPAPPPEELALRRAGLRARRGRHPQNDRPHRTRPPPAPSS